MKKTTLQLIAVLMCLGLALAGCGSSSNGKETNEGDNPQVEPTPPADDSAASTPAADQAPTACSADGDCVPAECCHAKACVHKDQGPDCDDIMCTQDCVKGTMDCGKGSCACEEGTCAVKWRE